MFEMSEVQHAAIETVGQGESAWPQYLQCRKGVFYFKRKIPAAVRKARGMETDTFWRSLDTRDIGEAIGKLAIANLKFEMDFQPSPAVSTVRQAKPTNAGTSARPIALTKEHLPAFLERYEYAHLVTDDEDRQSTSRSERQARLQLFEEGLEHLLDLSAGEDFSEHEELAQTLLKFEGLSCSVHSQLWKYLLSQLLAKDIEVLKIQCERLRGQRITTPLEMPASPTDLATLRTVCDHWSGGQDRQRTVATYDRFVEAFHRLFGAMPIAAISPKDVSAFRDDLHRQGFTLETIKNYVGGLATLVDYGVEEGLYAHLTNPFRHVSYRRIKERPASEDRRAFEEHELTKLYTSDRFASKSVPGGQAREAAYWVPLMGPFVGARIEELAQLRIEDVFCLNGVMVLRVCDLDEFQHTKTEGSSRLVPIHEELIRLGFLVYVAEQKLAGCQRVFPSLKNDNMHQIWSNALGKSFGRHLREVGLDDPRLCYHSYRFTFKQRCAIVGVAPEVRDALTGHWCDKSTPGRRYLKNGKGQYPLDALKAAMDKLTYSQLNLKHLHVAEPLRLVREAFGSAGFVAAATEVSKPRYLAA